MSIAIVALIAISFVGQILLIRHKWHEKRWYDLMWDLPAFFLSLWLGMVGGATVMAAMIVASNVLSVVLLLGEDRTPQIPDLKASLKKTINDLMKELKP